MKTSICPYLGIRDDPSTALDFPSEGNFCHRAPSKPEVNRVYQRDVCLSEEHIRCPLMVGTGSESIPAGLAARHPLFAWDQGGGWPRILWLVVSLLILSSVLLFSVLSTGRLKLSDLEKLLKWDRNASDGGIKLVGLSTKSPNTGVTPVQVTPGGNSISPFDEMITPGAADPSLIPCKPPPGWVIYAVKPTDSLFRLSLVYNIAIADLQMVNCMGNNTVIQPGDNIYVPGSPTATPTSFQTATQTPWPTIPLAPTARNQRPQPTHPPSTPVPPTATPKPTHPPEPQPTNTAPPAPTSTRAPTILPTKPPVATPTSPPS